LSSLLFLAVVHLAEDCLRFLDSIGIRRELALPVSCCEFTEDVDKPAEHRQHFGSVAMCATEPDADSFIRVGDNATTFAHTLPPHTDFFCLAILNGRIMEATRSRWCRLGSGLYGLQLQRGDLVKIAHGAGQQRTSGKQSGGS